MSDGDVSAAQAGGDSFERIFDKTADFVLKHKAITLLLAIILIGMGLRYLAVTHVAPLADEMIHGTHAIGIVKAGVINLQNQGPLWSYLTDLAYRAFGVNGFSARFLSFFFGSLTILLVYLIGKRFFSTRIALIAATLLAFSAFHIRYALMEMDEAMIFFVLFAYYCFVQELHDKQRISLLAFVSMGVAILIKPIALPFLLGFALVFYASQGKAERFKILKTNLKRIGLSLGILFLFVLPVLAFNYILYTQKGITDVLFARFFGVGQEIYASLQGYDQSFSLSYFVNNGIPSFFKDLFLPYDPAIFILGIFGIALFFVKHEYKEGRNLVLFHLITLLFLLGTSLLPTHFVSFMPLLSLGAAVFINAASERLRSPALSKKVIVAVVILTIVVNLYILFPNLSDKSAFFQMRSYATQNIDDQDVIVADSRIYRGRIAWMFNDKAYIEATQFDRLLQANANLSGHKPTNVYYVECVPDDCGWGTIGGQPELNASMEYLSEIFRNASQNEVVLNGGGGYGETSGEPYFRVYRAVIPLSPRVFPAIYETHDWFYYPVRWAKRDWYDRYRPDGLFQISLQMSGRAMLWLGVFSAMAIALFLIVLFVRSLKHEVFSTSKGI